MSLSVDELRALARLAAGSWPRPTLDSEDGRRLAAVDPADVVAHLEDPDRNVRVAALRVLAYGTGPVAAEGILRGLEDPKKRVREVAAKSSALFVSDPRVLARLQQAVAEDETGSARPAFQVLAGLSKLEPVADALAALARLPRYRRQVLSALLLADGLTEQTSAILRQYVASGTREEAVAATRRLCGYRVTRKELLTADQLRIAERAWGDVYYWVAPSQS